MRFWRRILSFEAATAWKGGIRCKILKLTNKMLLFLLTSSWFLPFQYRGNKKRVSLVISGKVLEKSVGLWDSYNLKQRNPFAKKLNWLIKYYCYCLLIHDFHHFNTKERKNMGYLAISAKVLEKCVRLWGSYVALWNWTCRTYPDYYNICAKGRYCDTYLGLVHTIWVGVNKTARNIGI